MSKATLRSTESNLRRRGLHTICNALSEKLNGEKPNTGIQNPVSQYSKMEQVSAANMNLGGVEDRVITSVSHGTTNAPVVLAAAISNIIEHSYSAKPSSNGTISEKKTDGGGSPSSSSTDSSSSDSEGEGDTGVTTKEVSAGPSVQKTVITVVEPQTEGIKPGPRLRSQPQKYSDEMNKIPAGNKATGTHSQQKSTPKVASVGRVGRPPKATPKQIAKDKNQTPNSENSTRRRGRGCGECAGCLRSDCGTCLFCKDKPKFGGPGIKKQRCANRTCSNFVKKHPSAKALAASAAADAARQAAKKLAAVEDAKTSNTTLLESPAKISSSTNTGGLDIRSFVGKTPIGAAAPIQASLLSIAAANAVSASPSTNWQSQQLTGTGKVVAKVVSKSTPKPASPAAKATTTPAAVKPSTPAEKSVPPAAKQATPQARQLATPVARSPAQAAKPSSSAVTPAQQAATPTKKLPTATALQAIISEGTMKCVQCGRERKAAMARTNKFCTQRCIINWLDLNPDKTLDDAMGNDTPIIPLSITSVQSLSTSSPAPEPEQKPKKTHVSRALKNLQIDMALPGTRLHSRSGDETSDIETEEGKDSSSSDDGKGRKRARISLPSSQMSITTRATRRSLASLPAKMATKTTPTSPQTARKSAQSSAASSSGSVKSTPTTTNAGVKRNLSQSVPHPPALKKAKTTVATKQPSSATSTPKAVTFNLGFVQNSPDAPSSAPTFSLVPIDQFSAPLGGALISHESSFNIPDDLPSNVRSWTMSQVVHYFRSTSDCRDFAELFSEQEIDGTALLLLTHEALVKCLGIKLGRAVKIMAHVDALKHQFENKSQ